jgi:predicted TIM-barrel fold metal-dependent hydrolase
MRARLPSVQLSADVVVQATGVLGHGSRASVYDAWTTDALGVRRSVLLPIDFPLLSENSETWLRLTEDNDAIVCFGSVHPYRPGMRAHLDKLVRMGARGLKYHPAVQLVGPDDDRAMKLFRLAGERKLPVLFHCGPVDIETRMGRRLSQVKRYERALAENPSTTFVLGHSGALQMEEAIAFGRKYDNVYFEIASQSLPAVERLLDAIPPGRLMLGSDWPFYHQAVPIAKVLLATEKDEALRRAVLHDNAAKLFGLPLA